MKLIILENGNIKKHFIDAAIVDLAMPTISCTSIADAFLHVNRDNSPFILVSEIITTAELDIAKMNEAFNLAHFKGVIFLSQYGEDIIEMTRHISRSLDFNNVHGLSLPIRGAQFRQKLLRVMDQSTDRVVSNDVPPKLDINVIDSALKQQLFEPYLQAQVCSKSGQIKGFEILSRLCMDNKVYPPCCFIDTLIEEQRISEFTFAILSKTLLLLDAYPGFIGTLSLNIDYQSLGDFDFAEQLIALLEQQNFPVSQLTVEITENKPTISTSVMHNLTVLRIAGCSLSIDDFGTKSSGFTELLKFPFTEIKIDRGFINDMLDSPRALKVVKAICAVAHSLDCNVVAEGVENDLQRDMLRQLNVCFIQGYLYSKPVPVVTAMQLIKYGVL